MKSDIRREKERFVEELTAINLQRIWIIVLVSTALSLGIFLTNIFFFKRREVTGIETVDLTISLVMIAVVAFVRRGAVRMLWRRALILSFLALWLGVMDAYFFTVFSMTGHNTSYVIGVIAVAVFLLLPPRVFFPMLIVNHAVYCALLLTSGRDFTRQISTPLVDGTIGAAIAGLASWILYHAARGNFFKERIIVQRNYALAATNTELREVMAIAAHDLQSPLYGVRDLLAVGRREPVVAEGSRLQRILDQARATCDGLAHLVSRLVAAHAAEETQEGLSLVAQDLRPACAAAAEHLQATASAKEQRITLALPDESATAIIDRDTFAHVLENLLGNALKFSPRGAAVELSLVATDGVCRIEVRDEGPGVPEEERAKLFEKFHRGSAQPTGGETSTGLGLFIVRKLVEAMNGNVSHALRDGGGSVFAVEFSRAG
ncbi:MAG: sensor histidine kinase [Chthoniobacterales bacterium]